MSTPAVPYAAPWPTQFNRYAVQVYRWVSSTGVTASIQVPTGQWWRPVFFSNNVTIAAGAGNRQVLFSVLDSTNTPFMWIGTPAVLTTGQQSYILVGPGQTSFAEINGTASGMIALAMPEMIWQPGTSFRLTITNRQAGDSVGTGYAAVEIYTEDYNADGQLVPLATPLLT